ncbi:MAG TPA: DUF6427 family protein [Flavobacteriaceae bacterium]|nr:DUF6427 family protein [Flavobacteriaceae bacterium]
MIAKLFEQAKPALYLAVAVFMAVFFWYYVVVQNTISFTFTGILLSILHFGLYLVIMLLMDFIGRKNDLSKNKTYKILLFALFTTVLPETFLFEKTLLSLFFILLALRRIISLRSGIHIQKKIFDAALWISLASCFYFWSSLFFIALYVAIFIFCGNNYRHWFIPFLGMATVIIFTNIFTLLFQNAFYTPLDWVRSPGFDFSIYNQFVLLIPLSVFGALLIWAIVDLIFYWKQKKLKNRQVTALVLTVLLVSLMIVLLVDVKNGSELAFLVFPFAVLFGNYLSFAKDYVFKEIILWILLLLPFVMPFARG